jgi:hypothetical protein
MVPITCPKCREAQECPEGTVLHRCSKCQANIKFANCPKCRAQNSILEEWTTAKCHACGQSMSVAQSLNPWLALVVVVAIFAVPAWWLIPHSCFSKPEIAIGGASAPSMRFEEWKWSGILDTGLESRVTYNGRMPVNRIRFEAFSKDGTKIDDGDASHPALSAGQSGMVKVLSTKEKDAAKIVLTVE